MDGIGIPFTGIATNNIAPAEEKMILLASSFSRFLTPLLEKLASGEDRTERVREFNYPACLAVDRQATKDLGPNVAPYRARRSRPSIDKPKNWRTATRVEKRSRWAALSSLAKCKETARLTASWNKLSLVQRTVCNLDEIYVKQIFLRPNHAEIPLPKLRGRRLSEDTEVASATNRST